MSDTDSAMECGCGCEQPPDRSKAVTNQALMGLPVVIATLSLARFRARKLLLYLPLATFFLTLWRKWVCARCVYYGRECATLLGVWTAKMMPRDDSAELNRNTMIVDFALIGVLMAFPLREVFRRRWVAAAYLLTSAAGMGSILLRSCPGCANDFCPMKDLSRALSDPRH